MKKISRAGGADLPQAPPQQDKASSGIPRKTAWLLLSTILLAALVVRLCYVYSIRGDIFSTHLLIDAKFYDEWALSISRGDWLGREVFYQDPLYAYFLALCYRVLGRSFEAVRCLQVFIDVGTLGLVYLIGSLAFNAETGLLASGMGALFGPMIYYTGLLDKTTVATFLVAASLAAVMRAVELPSALPLFASGLIFGIATMARGNMLVVALGFFLWIAVRAYRAGSPRAALVRSAAFAAGIGLVVGAVALRNYRVGGDVVPLAGNGGLNFYLGNNPYSWGSMVEPPFLHTIPELEYPQSKSVAEAMSHRKLDKVSEVSRFWLSQGADFILGQPRQWLVLEARKFFLILTGFELPETYSFYYFRAKYRILKVGILLYGLLCPLGIVGAGIALKQRRAPFLHVFAVCYTLSLLAFYVASRYRFPLVIPFYLYGAWFLTDAWNNLRADGHKKMLPSFLALASATIFCNWRPEWMSTNVVTPALSTPYTTAGAVQLETFGDVDAAINEFEAAVAINPKASNAYAYLGSCYAKLGKTEQALSAYQSAVRVDPLFHEAYNNSTV